MTIDFGSMAKKFLIIVFLAAAVFSQYFYDGEKLKNPPLAFPEISAGMVRAFNLGLDSASAGFLWVNGVMSELPFLREGLDKYLNDLSIVNNLDPKFSFPYYWSLLVLPNPPKPQKFDEYRLNKIIEIGERGVKEADTDWRVSFYLAVSYHLYKNDYVSAAKYFDLAVRQPGIPDSIKIFAQNYAFVPRLRDKTRQIWEIVYKTAQDEETKNRALAYVTRFEELDFLEQAAKMYKEKYGKFPAKVEDMVVGKILKTIPPDPFGSQFRIDPGNGMVEVIK